MDQTTNVVQLRPAKTLGQLLAELKAAVDELDQLVNESRLPPGQLDPRD